MSKVEKETEPIKIGRNLYQVKTSTVFDVELQTKDGKSLKLDMWSYDKLREAAR
jgi:hypothetical protein